MTKDIKILDAISNTSMFNGAALLEQLGIDDRRIYAIRAGQESLTLAENMLLTILVQNPEALNGCCDKLTDLSFSISSKNKAAETIDQQVYSLLTALEKEFLKSGLTKDEFMYGNKNNNPYRGRVNDFFQSLLDQDLISEYQARCYQTPFWKSFKTGEPFKRSNFGNR